MVDNYPNGHDIVFYGSTPSSPVNATEPYSEAAYTCTQLHELYFLLNIAF